MSSAVTSWVRTSDTPSPQKPAFRSIGESAGPGPTPFYRSLTVVTRLLRLPPRPAALGPQGGQREDSATGRRSDAPSGGRGDGLARPRRCPPAGNGSAGESSGGSDVPGGGRGHVAAFAGFPAPDCPNRRGADVPGPCPS